MPFGGKWRQSHMLLAGSEDVTPAGLNCLFAEGVFIEFDCTGVGNAVAICDWFGGGGTFGRDADSGDGGGGGGGDKNAIGF